MGKDENNTRKLLSECGKKYPEAMETAVYRVPK
jgi:hypothetical protein